MILEMTLRLSFGSGKPSIASWKKIFKCLRPKACCLLSFFFHSFIFLHSAYRRSYYFFTYICLNLSTYLMKMRIKNLGRFAFLFMGFGCFPCLSPAELTIEWGYSLTLKTSAFKFSYNFSEFPLNDFEMLSSGSFSLRFEAQGMNPKLGIFKNSSFRFV